MHATFVPAEGNLWHPQWRWGCGGGVEGEGVARRREELFIRRRRDRERIYGLYPPGLSRETRSRNKSRENREVSTCDVCTFVQVQEQFLSE